MIIWSGHGILIPIFGGIGLFLGTLLGVALGGEKIGPQLGLTLGGIFGTGLIWLYALTFGKPTELVLQDPRTGAPVRIRKSNTFFFIPAIAWAILSSVGALFVTIIGIFVMSKAPSTPAEMPPGAAELSAAEKLISGKSHGIVNGNTPEARELASKFSKMTAELRDVLIEKGGSSKISLSGGDFLTFCQVSEHGTAFLVHVPSLRKFSDEAKKVMCDAAWFAATQAVADSTPLPKNLAVGVRGVVLYESIMIGVPTSAPPDDPSAGIKSRHPSHESSVLRSFFAPSTAPPSSPSSLVDALPSRATEEANTDSTLDTKSPAPTRSGLNEADKALALDPVQPKSEPSSEKDLPAPDPEVSDVNSVALPTPVKDWHSQDGRVLKASLLRFVDETGSTAEFKREDGEVFTIPVERFSPEAQDELREINRRTRTP